MHKINNATYLDMRPDHVVFTDCTGPRAGVSGKDFVSFSWSDGGASIGVYAHIDALPMLRKAVAALESAADPRPDPFTTPIDGEAVRA